MKTINPANEMEVPDGFRPMNSATQRLEVRERSGWHRHWFSGRPDRILRAQQAGYRFVDPAAVGINNFDLAGDAKNSGNSDLGSRVSVVAGGIEEQTGQPSKLYLMECPNHLFAMSRQVVTDRNEEVAASLRSGLIGSENDQTTSDKRSRYTKSGVPDLFNPNKR